MNEFLTDTLRNLILKISGETDASLVFLGHYSVRGGATVLVHTAFLDGKFLESQEIEFESLPQNSGETRADDGIFLIDSKKEDAFPRSNLWRNGRFSLMLGASLLSPDESEEGLLGVCFDHPPGDVKGVLRGLKSFLPWAVCEFRSLVTEKALRNSRKMLEMAEEKALFGSWYLDLQTLNFLTQSEGTHRLLDWSSEEEFPSSMDGILKRIHPNDRIVFKNFIDSLQKNQIPSQFPSFQIYIKGVWKYFEIWGELVLDHRDNPVGFNGSFLDRTETRSFEEVFKESERDKNNILNSFEEGGVIIDRDFCIRWVSDVFLKLFDLSRNGIVGKSCFQFLPEDQGPEARANYLESIFSHGISSTWDYNYHGKTFTFTGNPIYDDREKIDGAVLVVKDVTRKRLTEHQWIQARSIETVSRIARTITHEINNQLAVILGTAENLMEHVDEFRKGEVRQIFSAVENSRLFLQKLGSYSLSNPAGFVHINLNQLLESLFSLMREWAAGSVKLEYKVPSDEVFYIRGDRNFIQNCLLNLSSNICASLESGCISLSLIAEGNESGSFVLVQIEDDGVCLDPAGVAKFFVPPSYAGILDEVLEPDFTEIQETMEIHGGSVGFENRKEQGKRFTLSFPLENKKMMKITGESVMEDNRVTARILVVEDESVVRKILEMQISSFGYQVATAALPGLGIEYFKENYRDIDLVLLDMNMPEMDGLAVFRKMKEIDPQVSVMVLSGYSQHGKIEAALKEGVLDYMTKPVRKAQLAEKIGEILEKKKASKVDESSGEALGWDSLPVLDTEFLEEQFSVTPGLKQKIVQSFLATSPALIEELQQAVESGDLEKTAYSAHKCYGPLTSIGGLRSGACVKTLEEAAVDGAMEKVNGLMNELNLAFTELIDQLKDLHE